MIKLADGAVFDPVTKRVLTSESREVTPVEEDYSPTFIMPAPKDQVKLEDYKANPKMITVVMAVVSYTMIGLSDNDICYAMGCDREQLNSIREGETYQIVYNDLVEAFYRGQQNEAKAVIGKASVDAAKGLVSIATSKKVGVKDKLTAINSILDRNDVGKANNSALNSGLIIKVIQDVENQVNSMEINIG